MNTTQVEQNDLDVCAICLDVLQKGSPKLTTSCEHKFHLNCLMDATIHGLKDCPLCRQQLDFLNRSHVSFIETNQQVSEPKLSSTEKHVSSAIDIIDLSITPQIRSMVKNSTGQIWEMININTTDFVNNNNQHMNSDIVIVVDTSTSMRGIKIELAKKMLQQLTQRLTEQDRLSIITFNDTSHVLCKLSYMSENIKCEFESKINDINCKYGTNIWSGLSLAFDELKTRTTNNPITGIILMTDGQDPNCIERAQTHIQDWSAGITVSTIGYGANHDANICQTLAEMGKGTFHFVDEEDKLGSTIGLALGGVMSTVARSMVLDIVPKNGVSIVKIHTLFQKTVEPDRVRIHLNDIFQGEHRNILVLLNVGENVSELADVHLSFSPMPNFEGVATISTSLMVQRPEELSTIPEQTPLELELQLARCDAAEIVNIVKSNIEKGSISEAKKILTDFTRKIANSPLANDNSIKAILSELNICISHMNTSSGRAHLNSTVMELSMQRANRLDSIYTTQRQSMSSSSFVSL